MTKTTKEKVRWWMIRSQQLPLVAVCLRSVSRLALSMACKRLLSVRGVAAVYARHTHPGSTTFVTGQSDVDLTVILDESVAGDYGCTREIASVTKELGDRYLFTKAEDARFMSEGELSRLSKTFISPLELLCVPEDWLLLYGREVRHEKSQPFPAKLIPRHPEFNRWWQNVIQEQFFGSDSGVEKGYMRSIYRSAIKNQVHLEAALAIPKRKTENFVTDDLDALTFTGGSGLLGVLQTIKQRDLWTDRPDQKKAEIFLEVLRSTENCFANCEVSGELQPGSSSTSKAIEPHASVYSAVQENVAATPNLRDALASAVVYPLPHAYPYIYRLDLILEPDVQLQTFMNACSALRSFAAIGKSFAAADAPIEFTLIPWGVYQNPNYYLGSDCPFLLEHIKRFGSVIHGVSPYPASEWTDSSLTEWCRIYLPFHMVTFRRRLDYGAPVLNFCQLASLRLFLETGERVTDFHSVRNAYEAEFITNDRDRNVTDFVFRYPCDRAQPELYDEALRLVSDTYDQLEQLLTNPTEAPLPRRRSGANRLLQCEEALKRLLNENILPFWFPEVIDADSGGYRLNHDPEGRFRGASKKHIVSQSRTLWFFSRLAGSKFGKPEHLKAATHGYEFLRNRMWDREFGGFYWELDATGNRATEVDKHLYGQAFGLYALSEYANVSGDPEARMFSEQLFRLLEVHAHDSEYGGYHEFFRRDWSPVPADVTSYMDAPADAKQLNTHLHLMESMIPYVHGSPDSMARERLIELIFIQSNAVVRKTIGACSDLHGPNWKPLVNADQTRVTFGHDLENVWLLIEACKAAGVSNGPLTDLYRELFKYSVQYGFDNEKGGFYYAGFFNKPAHHKAKIWWVQAEALACALQMYILTGDTTYFDYFSKTLDWITKHQADWKHGDWYFEIAEDGTPSGDKAGDKPGAWKTPYHNGRAVLMCLDLISGIHTHSL